MHSIDIDSWRHEHSFGTDIYRSGERRTRIVSGLTLGMMAIEIGAGMAFGSMALLADGWHMGTHAAALGLAAFAYWYARRRAHDPRYSFGTGKVSALAGFASAVSLAVIAFFVFVESVERLWSPLAIHFDEALLVAVVGLGVNLASAALLRGHHHEDPQGHAHGHDSRHQAQHHDHNLRGAYLHVVADALTSVLAIAALLAGKLLGWLWMDALSGVLGAVLIGRWSFGLVRDTAAVLLDSEVHDDRRAEIKAIVEAEPDTRVVDLHLWRVGPHHLAAILSVVAHTPRAPQHYKALLQRYDDLAHVTVEVQCCHP